MSLTFDSTPEREYYLLKRGKVILSACPGSGKTTVLAYKLQRVIEEVSKKHGHHAGVLCLSFTNVAKEEILEKYRLFHGKNLSSPSEVSTINSFINTYITLPFYRAICHKDIRPQILEGEEFDKALIKHIYFNRFTLNYQPIYYSYPPRDFRFSADGTLTAPHNLPNANDEQTFQAYATELKRLQLLHGIFKNDQSTFVAYKILEKIPRLGEFLSERFPYIFIDEAQDTTDEQFLLIQKLLDFGLDGLEIIGDHYQSLYEWRYARPDLFFDLGNNDDWQKSELKECRRSTQPIVNAYSIIRTANSSPIRSSIGDGQVEYAVQVILFDTEQPESAVNLYEELSREYEEKKVLVRGNSLLKKLNGTSTSQLPWKSDLPLAVIKASRDLKKGKTKTAINDMRSAYIKVKNLDLGYSERQKLANELKGDYQLNAHFLSLIKNMPSLQLSLCEWTSEAENYFNDSLELNGLSFELKRSNVWKSKYATATDSVLGLVDNPITTEISTIHGVKGMTLQSVFVLLDSRRSNNTITVADLTNAVDMPTEKQRLLYVAMSRAEHLLVIGIPKTTCDPIRVKEIFGQHVMVHEL